MILRFNKDFNYLWRNPVTKKLCYIAYHGITIARVEDIVSTNENRNTRILCYKALMREVVKAKKLNPFGGENGEIRNINKLRIDRYSFLGMVS